MTIRRLTIFGVTVAILQVILPSKCFACVLIPRPIAPEVRRAQSIVIGTATHVAVDDLGQVISAQIHVDASLKAPPSLETVSLFTPYEISGTPCASFLLGAYKVGNRYLLMLPSKRAEGEYEAPLLEPNIIRLEAEPSAEEDIFLDYIRYIIEHDVPPVSISMESPSVFISGEEIVVKLTIFNHMLVPLSAIEPDKLSPSNPHFGVRIFYQGGVFTSTGTAQGSNVVVLPNEGTTIELNLTRIYGVSEPGTYEIYGAIGVPLAPGRGFGDILSYNPFLTFTVEVSTSVESERSWASVKNACCS